MENAKHGRCLVKTWTQSALTHKIGNSPIGAWTNKPCDSWTIAKTSQLVDLLGTLKNAAVFHLKEKKDFYVGRSWSPSNCQNTETKLTNSFCCNLLLPSLAARIGMSLAVFHRLRCYLLTSLNQAASLRPVAAWRKTDLPHDSTSTLADDLFLTNSQRYQYYTNTRTCIHVKRMTKWSNFYSRFVKSRAILPSGRLGLALRRFLNLSEPFIHSLRQLVRCSYVVVQLATLSLSPSNSSS